MRVSKLRREPLLRQNPVVLDQVGDEGEPAAVELLPVDDDARVRAGRVPGCSGDRVEVYIAAGLGPSGALAEIADVLDKPTGRFSTEGMAPVPARQERAERSRRAILDAATTVFAAEGYTAASLNRIIDRSGLTKGGFYFHFPSKQALALSVVADHQQRWFAEVLAQTSIHDSAVDRLFATPRVIARMATEGRGPDELRQLIDELARDPDLREEVCGTLRTWVDVVAEQFAEAQREGAVRADLDPHELAEVAVGSLTGLRTMTEQLADGDLVRRVDALIRVVRAATLTPTERR
jgi:AcrR family transcriptional regulator